MGRRRTLVKVEPSLGTLGVPADTLGIVDVQRERFGVESTALVIELWVKVACLDWEVPGARCEKGMSWRDNNLGDVHQSLCRGPMGEAAFGCSVLLAHVGAAGLLYSPWFSDLSAIWLVLIYW